MKPFEGIRVLDFTHVYAGPFSSYLLAIMGAEVIKIEPPDNPDMTRYIGADAEQNAREMGLNFQVNNQGKKSITLDLKKAQDLHIAEQLISTADVLIENYTNGLAPFGLGPDEATALNPKLIYCAMSGYGKGDHAQPPFGGRPAYDVVIQATSGVMSLNGESDSPPLRVGPPMIDYGTGAQAAFAIASALYQRTHSKRGQIIHLNMQDAAQMMIAPLIADALHRERTPKRSGNVPDDYPGYAVFRCAQGDIQIGAFTPAQHQKLFTVLKIKNLPTHEKIDYVWLAKEQPRLRQLIQQSLLDRDADYWETLLNQHDVPAARVRDLWHVLQQEQQNRPKPSQNRYIANSPIGFPVAAFDFAEDGPQISRPSPVLGQHNEEIRRELGLLNEDD